MSGPLRLEVDGATCISSGYCRRALPDVFGADDKRKAIVLKNPVDDSPEVWDALESCPVEAIRATSTETGETVFP
ncbi:MAG: ferredoxin [Actinomycetes bacterium]